MKFLALLGTLILALALGGPAHAQAPRTWVSGVGDDANPGSRTAPCKTFAGAISKTAARGEIDALDPGSFGAVTITKSITLDGGGEFASILAAATNGVTINAGVNDTVVLRRLSLNGAGTGLNGIRVIAAGRVIVERCFLSNFTGAGVLLESAGSTQVAIVDTSIDGGAAGVQVSMAAAGANVSLNRVGISNAASGVRLVNGTVDLSDSTVALNGTGLLIEGGVLNNLSNFVQGNGADVTVTGGAIRTFDNLGAVGLSMTQDTTAQTVATGQSAVYHLTVAPPPGGFPDTVQLACVGLPSSLSATFTPSTLPAGSGAADVTLTLDQAPMGALPALGVVVVAVCLGLRRLRPRLAAVLLGLALLTAGTLAHAATGTFSFTVTATSGEASVSQLYTVTIQ